MEIQVFYVKNYMKKVLKFHSNRKKKQKKKASKKRARKKTSKKNKLVYFRTKEKILNSFKEGVQKA